MASDYLSEIFESAYKSVVTEWVEQGLTETEIMEKLSQDKLNDSMKHLLDRATKDYLDYFMARRFEISHNEKANAAVFLAHQNEIWGECFAVSETMYVMAVEAAEQ